jgi:class III poly(R)-hydroxyalkanoic acid synthase PhaE subunit
VSTWDFRDQFQAMAKTWLDAQRQLGESWLRALSPFPVPDASPDGDASSEARAGEAGAASQGSPAAVTSLTEGLTAGYRTLVRMFELSFGSFTPPAFGGFATPGAAPAGEPALNAFFAESARRLQGLMGIPFAQGPGTPYDMASLSNLWFEGFQKMYGNQFQKMTAPWLESLGPRDDGLTQADGDRSVLSQFTDLYWDTYERTMGRLLESPSVGYRREFDQRLMQSYRAWLEFRRASFDYLAVLGEAWVKTLTEMMVELDSMTKQGKTVDSLVDLFHLWTKVADRVLIETFGQEEYARVQGRLLNAAMNYRLEERQTADVFLKMSHLPSRTEVDEVTKEMHQLRRELRELRRRLVEKEADSAGRKTARSGSRAKKKAGRLPDAAAKSESQQADKSENQQAAKGERQQTAKSESGPTAAGDAGTAKTQESGQ